ncbi:MAG: hypothetical protein HW390_3422 [Candidatus Brocadiaceae bacterium]|nr:hypothetical protein [Candidatus Brocadiaceae bacterium]
MSVTYTNRKGRTYYLCQGVTKAGKPRYYFATAVKGNGVEGIPEGYVISESVNGVVSLAKDIPSLILEREINVVKKAVQKHPQAKNYRVSVKSDRIEIYEHVGPKWITEYVPFGIGCKPRRTLARDRERAWAIHTRHAFYRGG